MAGRSGLSLLTSRAKAMTSLRGYSAEGEQAYGEALALVKEHGEVPQLFPVLRNLASFHGYRGEVDKAIEYAHEILRLDDAQDDAGMRVSGYTLLGANTGFAGDLQGGTRLPRPGDRDVRERRLPVGAAGCGSGWIPACHA